MFCFNDQLELRKIVVSSLVTCIYLPVIITAISYKGLLYTVGTASSFYITFWIFISELIKSIYLYTNVQSKKSKISASAARDFLKACFIVIFTIFGFFVAIILFGAPAIDKNEETLMLSALLTILTVFPLTVHTGVSMAYQLLFGVRYFSKNTIIEMLVNNALLTICGAWIGAVVIPLDWNTPWQKWPIPCYLGAIGGYLFSNVLSILKITLMLASPKYPALNFLVNILNKISMPK